MNTAMPEEIQQAVNLIRSKKNEVAVPVLAGYLQKNPRSEEAWYLLSFAVPDLEDKTESLEQVLKLNPNNEQAKKRLQELLARSLADEVQVSAPRSTPAKKAAQAKEQPPPKKRRTGLLIIFLVFLCIIVTVAGYFAYTNGLLDGILPATGEPTEISVAPVVEASPTPEATLTETATATPLPTETATSTPTATSTDIPSPTASPTLAQAALFVAERMSEIEQEVLLIRELGTQGQSPRFLISRGEGQTLLDAQYFRHKTRPDMANESLALAALGLVEKDYDLANKIINNMGDNYGGFYDTLTNQTFIFGDTFGNYEQWVYARQYDIALIDQNFDLGNINVYPVCQLTSDQCLAIRAIVAGDATIVMNRWLTEYAGSGFLDTLPTYQPGQLVPSENPLPPYVTREYLFEYFAGQEFLEGLYDEGGWARVNAVYTNLPKSSEQVLHPDKYAANELPIPIDPINFDSVLNEPWRLLKTDVLGELGTQMILTDGIDPSWSLPSDVAVNAATGWDGDRYHAYYHDDTGQFALIALWSWDLQTDANEFESAMVAYLDLRYSELQFVHPGWDLLGNAERSCHLPVQQHPERHTLAPGP